MSFRALAGCLLVGCGPAGKPPITKVEAAKNVPGVEVHAASGRPRLVVVRRDGDPSAAIAIELRGEALSLALVSALVGARLESAGFSGVEVIPGMRIARVRALAPQIAGPVAKEIDGILTKPLAREEPAMVAVRRARDAYATRPIDDPALARATRCLDLPVRAPSFVAPAADELPALAESMRARAIRSDLVVVAAVAAAGGEAFAQTWRGLPPLAGSEAKRPDDPQTAVATAAMHASAVIVIEGAPRAALLPAMSALADRESALSLRLRAADDWRVRGLSGAARPEGACIVIEVEPARPGKDFVAERFVTRAAGAAEVARQELEIALENVQSASEEEAARAAIGAGSDPREAADRAAFWSWPAEPRTALVTTTSLTVPAHALSKGVEVEAMAPRFVAALGRARLASTRPEIELRGRVEAGQGELWAALASPCSVAHESAADAGLASVAVRALVASHNGSAEAWASPSGVGVVAHAAPRPKESGKELAHRVGDALGRLFLSSFPDASAAFSARNEMLAVLGGGSSQSELVRASLRAVVPLHPSWLDPSGTLDAVAKIGVESIELRLATLRIAPLRLAILANESESQIDGAARAAERWLPRAPGESRVCPVVDPGSAPKGAVHSIVVKAGTGVALAMPVEESQRDAAVLLAAALDGTSGRLAGELGGGIATSWEARVVRGVGRHALVIVALAPDANVDVMVGRIRLLLDRLRAGLDAADLARAEKERDHAHMLRRLDPRARVIELFGSESIAPLDLAQLRAAAAKILDEDRTQLVVARLK